MNTNRFQICHGRDTVSFAWLFFVCVFGFSLSAHSMEIFVGPNGKADNSVAETSPLAFEAALAKASNILKAKGLPENDSLKITLLGGSYPFTEAFNLGREFAGSKDNPILIQAAPGADVVFDGRVNVANPEGFEKVTLPEERRRLAKSAQDNIVVKTLKDPALIAALKNKLVISLGVDNDLYLPAVYPNEGYAFLDTNPAVKESFPPGLPKDKQAYGVRAGQPPYRDMSKPAGWLGSLNDPRGAQAGIVKRQEEMAGTWQQWEYEIKRDNRRNDFSGFYEAIWKLSSMPIYSVNAEAKTLRLSQAFAYGFGWLKTQHFRVFGLLCELDQPGEWYFDTKTDRLYIYPPKAITKDTRIGLPVAKGFMNLKNTSYVSIVGINVRNVGHGTVFDIQGGSGNLIAGCSIKNCTATGAIVRGAHNGIRSCDFVDLNSHVNLSGGMRSPSEIISGHNYVENCHFYHKKFTHEKVNITINGVGNTFKNNLVHNSIGQAVVVTGNDQTVELNEFFNIGYEEGDGGAVYSGADLTSYGNLYRHNFFHHLMRTPNKDIGRNGIHLDDLQAGATCVGNIFYKSCNNGICMNGGAGNSIIGNVFLAGDVGVFNRGNWGVKAFRQTNEIAENPNHDYAGLKEDYVGRAEEIVGKKGWLNEPWATKYPLFKKVMSDEGQFGRLWPIHCTYKNNVHFENRHNSAAIKSIQDVEGLNGKYVYGNDIVADKSFFKDYDNMDFGFARPIEGVDNIPFDKIGLYLDAYRKKMPDKKHYRTAIKKFFEGNPSYAACPKRIDTSKLVEEGPMIESQ